MGSPTPAALSDLLLRVYRLLEDVPFLDSITANVAATPTAGVINLTVNDPTNWPAGSRFEVDQELFYVQASANGANPVPVMRAYEGTYAAAHTSGTMARRDPRFPNATIIEAINVAYTDWCSFHIPKLVWDTSTGGTYNPITWIITAPSDALAIRRVVWQIPGLTRFRDLAHFTDLQEYPTTICSTGKGFEITESIGLPGTSVQVLYEKRWPFLVNQTDTVDADFPQEGDDLIPLGAILYIAGVRMTPKWRVDETIYYREQSAPLPPQFNQQWLQRAAQDWYKRAREVKGRRPDKAPQIKWIGRIG